MKLTFLGTGAADWTYNDKGIDGFRYLSGAMLGDDTLIDCGAHLFEKAQDAGVDLSSVRFVIVTHTHADHFSLDTVKKLASMQPITVCIEETSASKLPAIEGLTVVPLKLFAHTALRDMAVVAMPANHSITPRSDEHPVHYVIYKENRILFWGCDGAWMLNSTWHAIKNMHFDLMVLDGTLGDDEGDNRIFEHNDIRMAEEMTQTFIKQGMLGENGKAMLSHFSRFSHTDMETLAKRLAQKNILTAAYDGLQVNV